MGADRCRESYGCFDVETTCELLIAHLSSLDPGGTSILYVSQLQTALLEILDKCGYVGLADGVQVLLRSFCSETAEKIDYKLFVYWLFDAGHPVGDCCQVFAACSTNGHDRLNIAELKRALEAFGLCPTDNQLRDALCRFGYSDVNLPQFLLVQREMQNSIEIEKGHIVVPYARRGLTLEQLSNLSIFLESGWLGEQCEVYNKHNSRETVPGGICQSLCEDLYGMDILLVRKVTDPGFYEDVPEQLRMLASLERPTHKCSYSELINPHGIVVNFFVSHFWGHPFDKTLVSLRNFAFSREAVASSTTFWICLFALNQHYAATAVGDSPEVGPFNAALVNADMGAVMIVDENLLPLKRVWCLYEVHRGHALHKPLQLISDFGPVVEDAQLLTKLVGALHEVSAFSAKASLKKDKIAIWYRIMQPAFRHIATTEEMFERWFDRGKLDLDAFADFDIQVARELACPLLNAALRREDVELALRCLGWGAAQSVVEIERAAALCGGPETLANATVWAKFSKGPVSLLHVASRLGDIEIVRYLCENRANFEARCFDEQGFTPLHLAAIAGHIGVARLLIDSGANVEAQDQHGRSPVHIAAFAGDNLCFRVLIDARASLEAIDNDGKTPVHYAALAGCVDILRIFRDANADMNAVSKTGQAPAHYAAIGGHVNVLELLRDAGANLETARAEGKTPAHFAASYGHVAVLKFLAETGVCLQAALTNGRTPAHLGAMSGHLAALQFLLDARVDLGVAAKNGQTPAHLAASHGQLEVLRFLSESSISLEATDKSLQAPVHCAASSGHVEILEFLKAIGVSLEALDGDARSPAHIAAFAGQIDVIRFLQESQVNLELADRNGQLPSHLAASCGHLEVMKLLVEARAGLSCVCKKGLAPIMVAAVGGHAGVVSLLLTASVDPRVADNTGRTPAHLAAGCGQAEIVKRLWLANADLGASAKNGQTPAHGAAMGGHVDVLHVLRDAAVDLQASDREGRSAAHFAARAGHVGVLTLLAGAGVSLETADRRGQRPTHYAANGGRVEALEVLRAAGANLDAADASGARPLDLAERAGQALAVDALRRR